MKWAAVILILGMTLAVFTQVSYLEHRQGFRMWGYGGERVQSAWSPRVASFALAGAVRADRSVAGWTAAWFLLSCAAWFVARGENCIAPCALLGVAVLAIYHPLVGCGSNASEGPTLFWFTLAAITRKRARTFWPLIGLAAIPFKQTGLALVLVAAIGMGYRRGVLAVAAGLAVLAACAVGGAGVLRAPLALSSQKGLVYLFDNLRHLFVERPLGWLVAGGTALAGLWTARGPVLTTMLLIGGVALVVGRAWEPRLWIELTALSAGVLGDRGGTQ